MKITNKNFAEITAHNVFRESEQYEGDLSAYLRSLWRLALQAKDEAVTFQLLHDLIIGAFRTEPIAFDPAWLEITDPDCESADVDNEDVMAGLPQETEFDLFRRQILFHIADYHRMEMSGQLKQDPAILYFGISSPSGNTWYNFHPVQFLECALSGFDGKISEEDAEKSSCDWLALANLVVLGRVYE